MYFMVIVVRRYRCYNIVVGGVEVKADSVITCVIEIIVVVVFGCLKTKLYQW